MLDIDSLQIDPVVASQGTWSNFMGGRFLIARYNNTNAQNLKNKLVLEHLTLLQSGTPEGDAKAEEIDLKVLTETILLDWENIGSKDKEIKYTPAVGAKYLGDPRFSELREHIQNYSIHRSNYQEKVEEQVAESVKDTAAS